MWYVIDAVDRVADLCADWDAVAMCGGAPELTRSAVLGRPIWSFIEGEATRFHYAQVFETARQTGVSSEFQLCADAPRREAVFQLTVIPRPDQTLRIEVATMTEHPVPEHTVPEHTVPEHPVPEHAVQPRPLWDMHLPRDAEHAVVCSWCKSVEAGPDRRPADMAERLWQDLASPERPELRQHICPSCEQAVAHVRQAMTTYADKLPR